MGWVHLGRYILECQGSGSAEALNLPNGVTSHADHDITDDVTWIGCEGITLSLISQKKTMGSMMSVTWNVKNRYRIQIYGCRC